MVVAELGLDEEGLDEALSWARGRADELLAVLDDAELRALLEPVGRERYRSEVRGSGEAETVGEAEAIEEAGAVVEAEAVDAVEEIEAIAKVQSESTRGEAAGIDRRETRRYSLVEPAVIEISSWSELVSLYTKDIGCGGMFVVTETPPPRDTEVGLQLLLPDEAGTLDFQGVVVHVVTAAQARSSGRVAGFGLQFSGLTPERRQALQRLIEHAETAATDPDEAHPTLQELGFMCAPSDGGALRLTLSEAEHQQMQQLRSELAAMTARGDLELLGLQTEVDRDVLRDTFERLARRWHPSVAHRDAAPEIRRLATEIFLRIEQAYRRLCEIPRPIDAIPPPPPFATTPPTRAKPGTDEIEAVRAPTAVVPAARAEPVPARAEPVKRAAPSSPASSRLRLSAVEADVVRAQQRASMARRMVGKLVERSEELAARLRRRDPPGTPSARDEHRTLVDEALRLVADKQYAAAASKLEQALMRRTDPRVRVLLCVVQARQALTERDFPRARASYEAVLRLDPNNALAQRELLMLSALQR